MRRRYMLAALLASLLFLEGGISKWTSVYAMENLYGESEEYEEIIRNEEETEGGSKEQGDGTEEGKEKEEDENLEIIFPEFWIQSAVNDVGTTVTDEDGSYYFRKSMQIVFQMEEESGEEVPNGQFVIQRDGEDLICEDGYFVDVLEEDGEYVYTMVYIAEDDAVTGENVLTVRGRKVTDEPSVSVIYVSDLIEMDGKRYFTEDPDVRLCTDSSVGILTMEYREGNGEYVIWKDFRKEDTCYVYGEQTVLEEELKESEEFAELLTDMGDGSCSYTFRVMDVLGGTAEAEMEFIIDKTAPDPQVFVSYTSDGDNPETTTGTGIMDFVHSITNWLFGKTEVWFDLYVTDGRNGGQGSLAVSGIDTEDLCGQIVTTDGKAVIRKLQVIDEGETSFLYDGEEYDGYAHIGGYMALPSGSGKSMADRLRILRLKDRAGNMVNDTDTQNMTGATVICIDQKPPRLSVDYGSGVADEEKRTVFYSRDAVLKLVLKEDNYRNYAGEDGSPVTPMVELTDNGDYGAAVSEWRLSGQEGSQAIADLQFPAVPGTGEAMYDFTVKYQDGAGNLLEPDGEVLGDTKNGVYTGYTIVIDDRAPELALFSIDGEAAGQCGGIDLYRHVEGEDVRFTFSIDDHPEYWNPETVKLTIWNLDTGEEAAALSGSSLQWKEDGRIHQAEYAFDGEEGMAVSCYQVAISYEDRAGNRMTGRGDLNGMTVDGVYTSKEFMLDHEDPEFSITFNDAVRLVKDGDSDPSQDLRDCRPQTGYTAYYDEMVEVIFSIREQCAHPVYQGSEMTGLRDFELAVMGKDGNTSHPDIHWEQKGNSYEGRFSLTEEGRYIIAAGYSDMAGNLMVLEKADGSRWEPRDVEDGSYESVPLVLDKTEPVLKISYVNTAKNEITEEADCDENGCRFFAEPVYLKLEVKDENLRFHELLQVLQEIRTTDCEGRDMPDDGVEAFLEKLDRAQIAEGEVTWYLPLMAEAVYEIPVSCADLSGNCAKPITERVCVDRTEPELELSYSVKKSGFLDAIRYRDLRYLFADGRMTIKASAKDQVSGVRSISYTAEEENGRMTEKTMDFQPTAGGDFEFVIPTASADFKGTVTAEVQDWSGNCTTQKCGHIVEGDEKHSQEGNAAIITETSPSRTVGGVDYYNTDIRFRLEIKDSWSGLKSVTCRGGNTVDEHREYRTGDDRNLEDTDIVYEYQEELILDAAANNENEVLIRAEYQDHAGHTGVVEQFYNIDMTVPVIEVEYDNNRMSDARLYDQNRVATVTIRERNFDPADVEFLITNTDGVMPSIGDWQESGVGDDTLHVCHVNFFADGDYTFTLNFTDLAGNRAEYGRMDEFTIDQTAPVVTVNFMPEKNNGSEYYAQSRTAAIDVLEHNFDASLIQVLVTEQDGKPVPDLSGWRREGEHNVATIRFDADGDYTFGMTGIDQAGNQMNEYGTEHFIIDQTSPVLEISGLEDKSANKGAVTPVIRCTDANYQKGSMQIRLTGCQNGQAELEGERIYSADGETFLAEDFAYAPEQDDVYQLSVSVRDLAGNESHEEIQFSVNRFGSVYTLDDKTALLAGDRGIYYTNMEQDIIVTETNVDTLEFLEISCNRNGKLLTLQEGEDYYVDVSGTDVSWKQYVYTISGRNFTEEGTYVLTIYSEDRAENASDNQTKGKKIEFVMDKTAPSVLLSGLEDGGQYRENSKEITLDIEDNVRMSEVKVKINGAISTYHASEVMERDGRLTLMVGSADHWQTICVTAFDAAGNRTELDELRFLLTPNLLIQLFMNRTLFWGSMGGLVLICAGIWRLLLGWRRFRKCKERLE